ETEPLAAGRPWRDLEFDGSRERGNGHGGAGGGLRDVEGQVEVEVQPLPRFGELAAPQERVGPDVNPQDHVALPGANTPHPHLGALFRARGDGDFDGAGLAALADADPLDPAARGGEED